MNSRETLLHLSLIEGIGPTAITSLIANKPLNTTWNTLYDFSLSEWRIMGVSQKRAELFYEGLKDRSALDRELEIIHREGIQWATLIDDNYPQQLLTIHSPPPVIFWRGDLSFSKAVSIVGSRDANLYGERCVQSIVPELVAHGFCIVSGGALGADTMAHRAALKAGGKTIVVLGSGILQPAPKTNIRLFETILESGGAIISSFMSMEGAHPHNFPARNRIISGLSQGVVVVQAAQKSGTRITAQYALDQGRDVFAFPGSIDDQLSTGCHALIQQGAKLIMSPQDILSECGVVQSDLSEVQSVIRFDNLAKVRHANSNESGDSSGKSQIHKAVLSLCVSAQSIDTLAKECGASLSEMQNELFEMQMGGMIEQDFSGMWKRL